MKRVFILALSKLICMKFYFSPSVFFRLYIPGRSDTFPLPIPQNQKLREPANLQTGELRAPRADYPAAPELPKTQRDPLPLRPALPPDRGPFTDKEQWRVKNLQRKIKKIYINIYKSDKTIWLQKNPLFDIQTLSPEQSASFTVFSEFKNFRDLLPSPRYLCFLFLFFFLFFSFSF